MEEQRPGSNGHFQPRKGSEMHEEGETKQAWAGTGRAAGLIGRKICIAHGAKAWRLPDLLPTSSSHLSLKHPVLTRQ